MPFYACKNLKIVVCKKNAKIETIEKGAFCDLKKLEKVFIPSNTKCIGNDAFSRCFNLQHVDIDDNSKLQHIGSSAFALTSIKSFFIPSCISKISDDAFIYCNKIQIFEVGHDFDLTSLVNLFALNTNLLIMVSN